MIEKCEGCFTMGIVVHDGVEYCDYCGKPVDRSVVPKQSKKKVEGKSIVNRKEI
jgi:rRNA maturation endonuclease Nob1